jgi:hypothetical protein
MQARKDNYRYCLFSCPFTVGALTGVMVVTGGHRRNHGGIGVIYADPDFRLRVIWFNVHPRYFEGWLNPVSKVKHVGASCMQFRLNKINIPYLKISFELKVAAPPSPIKHFCGVWQLQLMRCNNVNFYILARVHTPLRT